MPTEVTNGSKKVCALLYHENPKNYPLKKKRFLTGGFDLDASFKTATKVRLVIVDNREVCQVRYAP